MQIRILYELQAEAAVSVLNALRLDMLKLQKGTVYHAEMSANVDA